MRDDGGLFVRRDLGFVPLWLRVPAWWLARREARALHDDRLPAVVQQLPGRHRDEQAEQGDRPFAKGADALLHPGKATAGRNELQLHAP